MAVLLYLIGLICGILIGSFIFNHKWKCNAYQQQILNRFYKVVDLRNKHSIECYNMLFHMQCAEYHPSKWIENWKELTGE